MAFIARVAPAGQVLSAYAHPVGLRAGRCRDESIKEGPVLILTRRIGESVLIGDDVSVKVLGINGNQVRVGIDAPKHIAVHREEIYERIKAGKCADSGAIRAPFS